MLLETHFKMLCVFMLEIAITCFTCHQVQSTKRLSHIFNTHHVQMMAIRYSWDKKIGKRKC